MHTCSTSPFRGCILKHIRIQLDVCHNTALATAFAYIIWLCNVCFGMISGVTRPTTSNSCACLYRASVVGYATLWHSAWVASLEQQALSTAFLVHPHAANSLLRSQCTHVMLLLHCYGLLLSSCKAVASCSCWCPVQPFFFTLPSSMQPSSVCSSSL